MALLGELAGTIIHDLRNPCHGISIPDDIKDHLFEPFVTSSENGGSGLGLAIAKSIVEAHGGRLLCESNPGAGTAFFLRLPPA